MNTTPRSPTPIYTASCPTEFQQLIREKSENFVGREFVFAAINEFLHQSNRGYFTLVGAPGSGKSAILAKYVTENPHTIYYNAQVEGKNRADQFLTTICTQLMESRESGVGSRGVDLPDNATEGSWFLSLLLEQISDNLEPHQRLLIVIDALDAIDLNSQSASSNLFYLPRYLPPKVYFLLARRPFLKDESGLLLETPSQILDLEQYPQQNREDVQAYIQHYLSTPQLRANLESWLTTNRISQQDFSLRLAQQSENNLMYLSQILQAIAAGGRSAASITQGFHPEPFQFNRLPPGLEAYYQSHWQRLTQKPHVGVTEPNAAAEQDLSEVELAVLSLLVQQEQPISVEELAQRLDEDEYEVEEILENWIEFLQQREIAGETCYSLYHSSFRHWLFFKIFPELNEPVNPGQVRIEGKGT